MQTSILSHFPFVLHPPLTQYSFFFVSKKSAHNSIRAYLRSFFNPQSPIPPFVSPFVSRKRNLSPKGMHPSPILNHQSHPLSPLSKCGLPFGPVPGRAEGAGVRHSFRGKCEKSDFNSSACPDFFVRPCLSRFIIHPLYSFPLSFPRNETCPRRRCPLFQSSINNPQSPTPHSFPIRFFRITNTETCRRRRYRLPKTDY